MDRSAARNVRRSQAAMASFLALIALMALTAALVFDTTRTNAPLRAAVSGTQP